MVHALASMTMELYDLIIQGSTRPTPLQPTVAECGRVVTELSSTASLSTRVLRRAFSHCQLS